MFRAIQSSISEFSFFRLISFLFHSNIAIISFSFEVTGVNLLLEINHSYLDMIMFNYIKVFCSSQGLKDPTTRTATRTSQKQPV